MLSHQHRLHQFVVEVSKQAPCQALIQDHRHSHRLRNEKKYLIIVGDKGSYIFVSFLVRCKKHHFTFGILVEIIQNYHQRHTYEDAHTDTHTHTNAHTHQRTHTNTHTDTHTPTHTRIPPHTFTFFLCGRSHHIGLLSVPLDEDHEHVKLLST